MKTKYLNICLIIRGKDKLIQHERREKSKN